MRPIVLVILIAVTGLGFFMMGGTEMLGLGQPGDLPETIDAPDATFLGNEQTNPFAQ